MAGCLITDGWAAAACDSRFNPPGIQRDEVWVFNRDDIEAYTTTIDKQVDAITMATGTQAVKIVGKKNTLSWGEVLVTDPSNYYDQSFSMKLKMNQQPQSKLSKIW